MHPAAAITNDCGRATHGGALAALAHSEAEQGDDADLIVRLDDLRSMIAIVGVRAFPRKHAPLLRRHRGRPI